MENLIHAIIDADKQAQQRVQEVEAKRNTVRKDAEGQKQAITQRYREEAETRLEEHKTLLQKELLDAKAKKTAEYEETRKQLLETFNTKKDDWIEAIVKRCQES